MVLRLLLVCKHRLGHLCITCVEVLVEQVGDLERILVWLDKKHEIRGVAPTPYMHKHTDMGTILTSIVVMDT